MRTSTLASALAVLSFYISAVTAQSSCPDALRPSYSAPVVANGWSAQIIAQGLNSPRGIIFDSNGTMLIVEQRRGIRRVRFTGDGTCLKVSDNQFIISNTGVGHAYQ
jgi:glucose/arabinose dehydrogenase